MTLSYLGYSHTSEANANLDNLWAAMGQQVFNVKSSPFNARGDGTGNDGPAIQAAITAAAAAGGCVFLPAGVYQYSQGLVVPSNKYVSFKGAGWGTTLKPIGNFDALTVGDLVTDSTVDSEVGGFIIDGTGLTGTSNGYRCNRMHSIRNAGIRVMNCPGVGIVNYRSYASNWYACYSNNNHGDNLQISEAADLSVYENCKFLASVTGAGVRFTNGDSSGCRFICCDSEGNFGPAMRVSTNGTIMDSLVIIGGYWESNLNLTMSIAPAADGIAQLNLLVVIGGHFNPGAGTAVQNAIALDRVTTAVFIGNRFNTVAITKTANTSAVLVDQSNSWGNTADCPTDVLVSEPLGHFVRRSVVAGRVEMGTDVDWEVQFVQNNVRRWRMITGDGTISFPKGSLLPVAGLADGQNPHIGCITAPVQAIWGGTISSHGVQVSANHNVAIGEGFVDVDASGGARTMTLPDPNSFPDFECVIGKYDATANNVVINAAGGATVNGAASISFNTQYTTKRCKAIGGAYRVW